METEVVAFSNAVAAETTFLLEEEEEEEENVRTSRECERVFFRRRPRRPSPSSPLSHLRATLYTTSFVSRTPVFCCRLFCCFSRLTERKKKTSTMRRSISSLSSRRKQETIATTTVEQEVDDDDEMMMTASMPSSSLFTCFYLSKFDENTGVKKSQPFFCFFAIFAIQFLVKKRQKGGRRVLLLKNRSKTASEERHTNTKHTVKV